MQYWQQCLDCGRNTVRSSHAVALRWGKGNPFDFDEALFDEGLEFGRQQREDAWLSEREEWFTWYNTYLASPQWRKKRAAVLARANGTCEGCRQSPPTQVHHLTYENVGDELLYQLVALCDDCHERAHLKSEFRPPIQATVDFPK